MKNDVFDIRWKDTVTWKQTGGFEKIVTEVVKRNDGGWSAVCQWLSYDGCVQTDVYPFECLQVVHRFGEGWRR